LVTKRKRVDSIAAPVIAVMNSEVQIKDGPLLNILEPVEETKKQKASNVAKVMLDKKGKKTDVILNRVKDPGSEILDSSVGPLNDDKKISFLRSHRKAITITLVAIFTIILSAGLLVGAAYAYQYQYRAKIFPGVQVWGVDAGGKNGPELQQLITEKIKNYKLTLKGPDQSYEATAEDLGVNYDSEMTISNAFNKGRTGSIVSDNLTRIYLLLTLVDWAPWQQLIGADKLAITPAIVVNDEKFNQYVTEISENINITAQDSEVNVTSGQIQLKPAIYGRQVLVDELKNQVRGSIADFSSKEIQVQTSTVKPAIIDTAAQEVMVQAQNVMQRPVILVYKGVEYRPNQETVASWISFIKQTGDTKYTLVVDTAKMGGYFDFLGTKINVYPTTRRMRVENGVKETETQAGANGTLIDETSLGKQISEQLPIQTSVKVTIPTYVATFKTEYDRVIIADWDKYIDVNLSTQTMTACEKGGVNCRQWYVMTGKNSTPTPVGTWLVQGRTQNFWMSGLQGTPDYYRLWVPYATWFKGGGYAIHSAQWRNNDINSANGFGNMAYTWNGSHGCVNSPDDAAQYIYNWAEVGTPVIVHY